jgi:HEAT repeat protein
MRPRLVPALIVLLALAAPALAAEPDPKKVRDLVKQLDDDEFDVREKADAALRKLGKDALPLLRKELTAAPSAEVRKRLDRIVSELDRDPLREKVQALVPGLIADDFATRERSTTELVRLGKDALPHIKRELEQVTDPEAQQRLKRVVKQIEK